MEEKDEEQEEDIRTVGRREIVMYYELYAALFFHTRCTMDAVRLYYCARNEEAIGC